MYNVTRNANGEIVSVDLVYDDGLKMVTGVELDHVRHPPVGTVSAPGPTMEELENALSRKRSAELSHMSKQSDIKRRRSFDDDALEKFLDMPNPGEEVWGKWTDGQLKDWHPAVVKSINYAKSTIALDYDDGDTADAAPIAYVKKILPKVGDRVMGKWSKDKNTSKDDEEMELNRWYKATVVAVDQNNRTIGLLYDDGDTATAAPPKYVKPLAQKI